jgi:ATP synthase protein I
MAADKFPRWAQLSGVGFELAGAVAGFTLIGYWADRHYGTGPWGLIAGVILGLVGGLYNLVKQSLRAVREAQEDDQADRSGE